MQVQCLVRDETLWLTQKAISDLFGVKVPAISKHLKNIFESGELVEDRAVSILETTAADGKSYQTRYYNLDAIIAVGYRVNSYQATQFRIWSVRTELQSSFHGVRPQIASRLAEPSFVTTLPRVHILAAAPSSPRPPSLSFCTYVRTDPGARDLDRSPSS